jgi:hypothetical protein
MTLPPAGKSLFGPKYGERKCWRTAYLTNSGCLKGTLRDCVAFRLV